MAGATPWRRAGNALAALAVGAAAVYAHTFVMDKERLDAPLTAMAAAGAAASTGRFAARLDGVVAARSLRLVTTGTDVETGATTIEESTSIGTRDLFLVATVGATSPKDPTYLPSAWLRTRDGIEYAASDRPGEAFTPRRPAQHGWWTTLTFVFEVPPEAVPGAFVVITAPSTNGIYDTVYPDRYDQLLPEVRLPLTAGDAATRRLLTDVKTSWQLTARR
ncbi:hypothetical protein Ssi03_33130 [Sphaerisporangium siamense]|uniref:Uncharacterized protein n=1 Tax=Sphaerisporangium siamense TaxID=795645 RepID=A0A7W7G5L5_9ACTN|nr:hypothetical protein [Sphaerisporangium siamense]MBB4698618.1 hypothetical protein [Sphaerisporangium siamense]GII85323.1 hypothetical protein Ssi03_33130 [Sphaerisporangium siamense]